MATDEERLLIRMEVSQRKIERQMSQVYKSAATTSTRMEKRFMTASRGMERSLRRVNSAASSTFTGIARLAAAALGGLGVRELTRYADSWTQIGNEIAAAQQISGTLARSTSDLNDIAASTRSGLEETANLYARLLRVSGQLGVSEEEVAQATETVAKAFKAGGAAASEQAAGILQLSQALGSGVLQGDELRSLRENAPLVAQAIADEFETTIGGLKELGAEGELTSERVFQAILNSQQGIQAAFAATTPTVQDAFTVLRNGAIEFIAAFDDGSGATESLSASIIDLSRILQENGEAAARFGGKISESFEIIGEAIAAAKEAFDFGDTFSSTGEDYARLLGVIVDGFQIVTSNAAGAGAAIGQSMLNVVQSVADASTALVNTVIEAIETMLNRIISGVNAVAEQLDRIPGVDTGGGFDDVSLPRFQPVPLGGGASPVDAYKTARDAVAATIQGARDGLTDIQTRVTQAGEDAANRMRPVQGPNLPAGPGVIVNPEDEEEAIKRVGRAARELTGNIEKIEAASLEAGNAISSSFGAAFTDIVVGAKSANQAASDLLNTFARMAAQAAFQGLIGQIGGLFGPGTTPMPAGGGLQPGMSNLLPSFQGGGYTGAGSRSGGVDGRGGFNAILHPNEIVTDLTRPGGMSGGEVVVRVVVDEAPAFASRVNAIATSQSVKVVQEYDKRAAPAMVQRVQSDPRRRG